ncbi:pilus assembly protein [Photobacterium kishitanii]|nr:pilus assembly protein [Photobacterium kishitanii]KJG61138.1 pilus assembly protein [Photobacterium kishitanii]KJG65303.1 pilus assembly protein [Photobacterium kishitanii]KJG68861.1 pilus assembly protein [Photobacterium kishitanii]
MVLLQELLSTDCDHMLFVLYNVMASTKETTWNIKVPQDANILLDFDGYSYRFRYAHMPLFGKGTDGYHAVIRVIAPNKNKDVCTDLKSLKITQAETKILNNMLSNPSGLIVVSGVTGSGKSTSLKNYMEYLFYTKYEEKGCFITVEDPVEYLISGVQQSSVVRSKEGKNLFADAVRSSLRRDPDVLMIGEIRDIQTGEALSSAVESGHLCLTTVHAGNAVGVLQRLSGLGVSIDKLSTPGFIAGIMNQLLVPKLCEHCSQDRLNDYTRSVKVKGIGCLECNFIGITGRTLVIEQLIPDITVLRLIADKKWVEIYEYLRGVRSKTAFGEGYTIKEKIYSLTLQGTVCSNYFKSSFGRMESENEELIYQVYKYKK